MFQIRPVQGHKDKSASDSTVKAPPQCPWAGELGPYRDDASGKYAMRLEMKGLWY